jgi:(1->4)-alpha-D-glucan 1-alpha-D-glucosylmutase
VQLTADQTFADVAESVPYLSTLGISHVYLSPVLEAVRGSTHGYDGTDPTRVSDERGGEAGLRALADVVHEQGMGLLVDIVPNHLAASDETPWWVDPIERTRVFDVDPTSDRYRRFFDIDGLAGVRQEDPEVFERTHAKVLELVHDGVIDGLRIDHPDGLTDPAAYLERLAERSGVPIWVEKILHRGEALRPWPVAGTVGYEFAADLGLLFSDPDGEAAITQAYAELTGDRQRFEEVAAAAKAEQVVGPSRREVDRLAALVPDVDRSVLEQAAAALPVYRTYVAAGSPTSDEDRRLLRSSGIDPGLADRLLLEGDDPPELIERFQQLTAPVTAKGVEDTAFYRSIRLLAHNEVGADPGTWCIGPDEFHAGVLDRAARHPAGLLAATTHDTKRSADARARLLALTWDSEATARHLRRWFELTEPLVRSLPSGPAPSDRERWYLFQTLIAAWPIDTERLVEHLRKAMREAGLTTSWIDPDDEHEAAVSRFVADLLELPGFWTDFSPHVARTTRAGERISTAQTLLRATCPGVCDVYQGDETWLLGLTDPDVRRPLDPVGRRRQLDRVVRMATPHPHTAKLHVLHRALELRSRRADAFAAAYVPLDAGARTVAFLRGEDVLVVVPLGPDPSAALDVPAGTWRDLLHPRQRNLGDRTPVASLIEGAGLGLWERT